jgi:hypothetical protein
MNIEDVLSRQKRRRRNSCPNPIPRFYFMSGTRSQQGKAEEKSELDKDIFRFPSANAVAETARATGPNLF